MYDVASLKSFHFFPLQFLSSFFHFNQSFWKSNKYTRKENNIIIDRWHAGITISIMY